MSVNICDIEITTGINKGKLCRDINKYCRHKKVICEICKEEFSHKSSYLRHKKTVHNEKQKVAIVKRNFLFARLSIPSDTRSTASI